LRKAIPHWKQWGYGPSIHQGLLLSWRYLFGVAYFLWRHIVIPRRRNIIGLWKNGRLAGRMWSKHLVFYSLIGPLFGTLLSNSVFSKCGRSWLLVWSCTTWSLRRSMTIMSMIRGGIFRWVGRS
jgi:hypothetical protein